MNIQATSLQDDIARYVQESGNTTFPNRIAAGLERDYYLVKLAELQPVGIRDGHYSIAGVKLQHESRDLGLLEVDRDYAIAVYEYAKARESKAAVLARRRDELDQALEAFTRAAVTGAPSLELAQAKVDLDAAYRAHVTTLHLGETVDGRAA